MTARITLTLLALTMIFGVANAQQRWSLQNVVDWKFRVPRDQIPELLRQAEDARNNTGNTSLSKRIGDEIVVSADALPESEVHAAVNPLDANNIVASAMRLNYNNLLQALLCPIHFSRDGGATWRKSSFLNLPSRPGSFVAGGGDPVLVFDANGILYFSWINLYFSGMPIPLYMEIFWAYSTDGGETWQRPPNDVLASAEIRDLSRIVDAVDKQWMAADHSNSPWRGRVYATYLRAKNEELSIVVRRKLPGVFAFEDGEVTITPTGFAFTQFTSIDVDEQGGVHIIFLASRNLEDFALYHATSTDGAESFGPLNKITDVVVPRWSKADSDGTIQGLEKDRVYPCAHVVVDKSAGTTAGRIHIVWSGTGITQREPGGADIYYTQSDDRGLTWSMPKVISDDAPGSPADQFHPSIAVNSDGVVAVTWYDRREDVANMAARYTVSVSRDGGATFTPSRPVAAAPMDIAAAGSRNEGFSIGEYTQVLMTRDAVLPFWADARGNDGNIDIYSARIDLATLEVDRVTPLESDFRLHGAWPNPFQTSTTVSMTLTRPLAVQLRVLDQLGRTVATLASGAMTAGKHDIAFNAAALPAGMYTLVLEAEGLRTSSRVILLK